MIRHIVMWRLKDEVEGKSKKENAEIIKEKLEGLNGEIEEILFLEVGININNSDQAYDVVLFSEFKNEEDLDKYQNHPKHVEAGSFIKKVAQDRVVVDYIV